MRVVRLLMLMVSLIILVSLLSPVNASPPMSNPLQEQGGVAAGSVSTAAGTFVHFDMTTTPPSLTPEQKAILEQHEANSPKPAAIPLPIGHTAVQRSDSAADANTGTRGPTVDEANSPQAPTAPGTFDIYRNAYMGATIKSNTSGLTGEPTLGNSGPIVFATGNWWGAISGNGGLNFNYISPYSMFPTSFGSFCCDQKALYEPARDFFIWYLQYNAGIDPADGTGKNIFRVAVASPTDALKGNWLYYDFPSAGNTEWDYPDMCLSNNWVYITTNRGAYGSNSVNDAWVFKLPLDTLLSGSIGYTFWDLGSFGLSNLSLKCTHGAREEMYFGSHNSTSQIQIFDQPGENGTLYWGGGAINLSAAWNNGTHVCPTPDGRDWCEFDDGRIKTGWMQNWRGGRMVGFMWNASGLPGAENCNGTALSCPYVEGARVTVSDSGIPATYTYFDRPFLWASGGTAAFQYAAASPNARGDLGITAYYGSSSFDPYFLVGIDDDYHRCCGWDVSYIRASSQGPNTDRWGDYFAVQPFAPTDLGWITIGTTFQGCGVAGCKESNYVIFGRDRDLHSVEKYWNFIWGAFMPVIVK